MKGLIIILSMVVTIFVSTVQAQTSHSYGPRSYSASISGGPYNGSYSAVPYLYVGIGNGITYRLFLCWDYDNTVLPQGATVTQVRLQFQASPHASPPTHFAFDLHEVGKPVDVMNYDLYYSPSSGNKVLSAQTVTSGSQESFDNTYTSGAIITALQNVLNSGRKFITFAFVLNPESNPYGFWELSNISLTVWFTTPQYGVTVVNSFGSGNFIADGNTYASGATLYLDWNTTHQLTAIDLQEYANYTRRYQDWYDILNAKTLATAPQISTSITVYQSATYRADFIVAYKTKFQNSFIGVGNGGSIKVNDVQYSSPTSNFLVNNQSTIKGEATYQVYSGIEYFFNHWNDGVTLNPRTFTPTDNATYTAYFIGKPLPMINYGLHFVGSIGQNIQLVWNDHPNTNVTQYQIWRKVKHSLTGIMEGPTLLTTLNRGTTSWTDYNYVYTDGYTDALLYYDVRPYYQTEGTYANESWITDYGTNRIPDVKQDNSGKLATVSSLPKEYSVTNYPNPFNPTTTIRFALPKDSHVVLKVYDMLGREVATLVDGETPAGYHEVKLDGTNLGSGIYLCRLAAGEFTSVMKILLMK